MINIALDKLEEAAREVATAAHLGQTRWSGEPYITHPRAVVALLPAYAGVYTQAAAWLHDVVEDTKVTLEDLRHLGFGETVVQTVARLTHRDGESYPDYIVRISGHYSASIVKIADLTHNMSDLKPGARKDKYELSRLLLTKVIQ